MEIKGNNFSHVEKRAEISPAKNGKLFVVSKFSIPSAACEHEGQSKFSLLLLSLSWILLIMELKVTKLDLRD